jgi:Na+/proline symporter
VSHPFIPEPTITAHDVDLHSLSDTLSGGLKSTFLADYFHTIALLVIVLYLSFKTLTNPAIDSLDGLWRLATAAATRTPVSDNLGGSYLTLTSPSALQFGVLHTLGERQCDCSIDGDVC